MMNCSLPEPAHTPTYSTSRPSRGAGVFNPSAGWAKECEKSRGLAGGELSGFVFGLRECYLVGYLVELLGEG